MPISLKSLTFSGFIFGFLRSAISDFGTDVKEMEENEDFLRTEEPPKQLKMPNVKLSTNTTVWGDNKVFNG
jgi:hypothetical protein